MLNGETGKIVPGSFAFVTTKGASLIDLIILRLKTINLWSIMLV